MSLSLATWNVNSLNARLEHLLTWLSGEQAPDALVLQEIKMPQRNFPFEALDRIGYQAFVAGQKSYNGVALLVKKRKISKVTDVEINIPLYDDEQMRWIAGTLHTKAYPHPIRMIGVYCPNGGEPGSRKFLHKIDWFHAAYRQLQKETQSYEHLLVAGDFNIAPSDLDVDDPKKWFGSILTTEQERSIFHLLENLGLTDTYRFINPTTQRFTWWDYRNQSYERNEGARIDHILISHHLRTQISGIIGINSLRELPRPSDHKAVSLYVQ